VIVELAWKCQQRDRLEGPFGVIASSGKRVEVPAVAVFRFDGDRILEMRHYFDLLRMLAQLGALPQARPAAGAGAAAPV
jgi:carboxymethylenebutenolidase